MQITLPGEAIAIICSYEEGKLRRLGTAFCFLKGDCFITAKHVVWLEDREKFRNDLTIITTKAGNKPLKVIGEPTIHEYYDLVLMRCENMCAKPLYPAHHDFVGKKGFIRVGYSPSNSTLLESVLNASHIKKYEIETRERDIGEETVLTFIDNLAEGGNSGAPLLGEGGGVVGVVIELWNNLETKQLQAKATSIQPIIDWFKVRNGS